MLPKCIDERQCAFVGGRFMFDGVLLSLIYRRGDSIKKKKKNAVINLKARADTTNI